MRQRVVLCVFLLAILAALAVAFLFAPQIQLSLMPAPTATPIVLEGTGDATIDLPIIEPPALVRIVAGPQEITTAYFKVFGYDSNGSPTIIVLAEAPLDHIRLLSYDDLHTSRVEVDTDVQWRLEVLSIDRARTLHVPGTISGNGGQVVVLEGDSPGLLTIEHDGEESFALWTYGTDRDLPVNDIGPYHTTIMLDSDVRLLDVDTNGPWTLSLSGH